ncbi:hypothetical protein N9242_02205 [Vicingaceae bacterium]|jgi:hypothetical protein|nr:hypothetical protein [Vicingaceae bacterium]
MKKNLVLTTILISIIILVSCGGKGTYFEQFSNKKTFTSRILDLNKTIDQVRVEEQGNLITEDLNFLEYVYEVGESDSYVISYRFDEKGCFEVGIDSYFVEESNAKNVVDGIKSEMNKSEFGVPKEDNFLCRWKNKDESISVELDYTKTKRGEFVATIFANE